MNFILGMINTFVFISIFFYLLIQKEPLAAAVSLAMATLLISIMVKAYQE